MLARYRELWEWGAPLSKLPTALTLIFFHWLFFSFAFFFFSSARDFTEEEGLLVAYGCQNDWTGMKISHIENL